MNDYMAKTCLLKGKPNVPEDDCKVVVLSRFKSGIHDIVMIGLDGIDVMDAPSLNSFEVSDEYTYIGFRDKYLFYTVDNYPSSYKWIILSEIIYTCNYKCINISSEFTSFSRNNPELFILTREDGKIQSPMIWYSNGTDIEPACIWGPYNTFNHVYEKGYIRVAVMESIDTRIVENGLKIVVENPDQFVILP